MNQKKTPLSRKEYSQKRIKEAGRIFFIKMDELFCDRIDFTGSIYKGSKEDIKVRCPTHGYYITTPNSLLQGCGCQKCGSKNAGFLKSKGKLKFVEESKEIHGNVYDYSQVKYVNNKTQAVIVCHIHGKFSQIPDQHLRGQGCPKCGHERSNNAKKITSEEFKIRSKEKHGNKISFNLKNYKSTKDKLEMTCTDLATFF